MKDFYLVTFNLLRDSGAVILLVLGLIALWYTLRSKKK
jgi:hypothetical protein